MTSAGVSLEEASEDIRRRNIMRSEQALDVTQSITDRTAQLANREDLYQAVGELMSRLSIFKQAMDTFSEVSCLRYLEDYHLSREDTPLPYYSMEFSQRSLLGACSSLDIHVSREVNQLVRLLKRCSRLMQRSSTSFATCPMRSPSLAMFKRSPERLLPSKMLLLVSSSRQSSAVFSFLAMSTVASWASLHLYLDMFGTTDSPYRKNA